MNKNTIVKLIAVLAMCFLIGGALVACKGAAGPAGPQGPQGEKGETGAAGSTPVLTIGANGNWFADGVDLGVKAPSADAACTEHDFAFIDVVKHTQTEDGVVVKACKSCGYAAITNETLHVMEAGEIPANCLEAKWVGEFCSVCNFKGEGEYVGAPNGHNYTKAQPVTDVNSQVYICVDGGMLVQHCKDCGDIQYTTVEAGEYPHTVYDWKVVETKIPTDVNYGLATGKCTICNALDSIELPFIDSEEYTIKTNKALTCVQDGEYEYTYVKADRNVNVSFKLVVGTAGHKINGVAFNAADYKKANDGTLKTWEGDAVPASATVINYWVGTADSTGRLSALDVTPFADDKLVCGKVTSCYFNCSDCNGVVYANVYYDHNGKSEYVQNSAPTCCATGLRNIKCDNCTYDTYVDGVNPEVVPALDHVYSYKLVPTATKEINGETVQLYKLEGVCTGNGIDKCAVAVPTPTADEGGESTPVYAPATDVLAENIYNVSKKVVKAPNCLEYGKITYTYNVENQNKSITKTLLVPKTNHILNGEEVNTATLTTTTPGINEMTGENIKAFKDLKCGEIGKAYFVCEFCATVEGAKKIVAVDVVKNHTIKADTYQVTKYPTCCDATCADNCTVHAGTASFECADSNCSETNGKVENVVLPALEHKYTYVIEEKVQNGVVNYVISEVCQNVVGADGALCGHSNEIYTTDKKPTVLANQEPTCYAEGYTTYSVVVNGEPTTLTITYEKVGHTVAGLIYGSEKFNNKYTKTVNGALVVLSTTPGVEVYANDALQCMGSVAGYFECEVCAERGVKALVNVPAVYKDHVAAKELQAPSCHVAGRYECADCHTPYTGETLEHNYDLSYEVTYTDTVKKVEIEGVCLLCGDKYGENNAEVTEMTLPELSETNIEDYYGKAVVVKKATCTEKAVLKYTISFKADGTPIKLNDKESEVFITVSFNVETAAAGHKYENCKTIVVIRDELLDEESEETTKCYYIVKVCTVCGYYNCVDKIEGEEAYADYLESLEENA